MSAWTTRYVVRVGRRFLALTAAGQPRLVKLEAAAQFDSETMASLAAQLVAADADVPATVELVNVAEVRR